MIRKIFTVCITLLAMLGFSVFLPMIVTQAAAIPDTTILIPPAGITCFWTDATSKRDSTGGLFVNCQAKDERGQVVWRQDSNGSVLVLESGYSGRGSLDADADGLWLTTADPNAATGVRMRIEGFVP